MVNYYNPNAIDGNILAHFILLQIWSWRRADAPGIRKPRQRLCREAGPLGLNRRLWVVP